MRKTLGVSMIVRNESEMIARCLDSVKDADEIVIVDTGSEDNTVEICKKYTDKIHFFEWVDDFAAARNFALEHADTDYILIIDADEVFEGSINYIKELLNKRDFKKYLGMQLKVQTGTETLNSIRIIKNIEGIRWHGAVHNYLALDDGDLQSHCYMSNFKIKSDYSPAHDKDPDRSLRILTKQLEKEPDNTRYLYYIAREYISRKDWDKAIDALIKYDRLCFRGVWTNEHADALFLLAGCYMEKEMWHESITAALKSILILPSYKEPHEFLSMAFKQTYPLASAFWGSTSKLANNAGVLFKRN